MEPLLAGRFKDERFADAYLSIRVGQNNPVDDPAGSEPEELSRFPVHLVILTQSHYFLSQVDFAEHQADTGHPASRSDSVSAEDETRGRPQTCSMGRPAAARSRSRSLDREAFREQSTSGHPLQRTDRCHCCGRLSSDKPTVVFTIEDSAHEPAVQAVIASMYGVKDAFAGLEQQQLVHAAWYADVLQVEQVASKVCDLLKAAAGTGDGLTVASLAALASWPSWPTFMLPLLPELAKHAMAPASPQAASAAVSVDNARNTSLQQVLLSVLGDLESVWKDQCLSEMLLQLPLPAMQLLLSSDKIAIYSEDTVLFTVVTYVERQAPAARMRVRNLLSDLVRAPHLSHFQLSLQAFDNAGPAILLDRYRRELQHLQSLKHHGVSSADVVRILEKDVEGVPGSWLLGPRLVIQPPGGGVSVRWSVPVSDLKRWCQECATKRATKQCKSPDCSPPISGVSWRLKLSFKWDNTSNGVTVGVYRTTSGILRGFFHVVQGCLIGPDVSLKFKDDRPINRFLGDQDFFKIGSMANGWDEAAWVSRGLPTEGSIELKLIVLDVC